jgi:hypothetical protein
MILENRAEPHGGNGRNEPPLARTPGADILLLNQLRGKLFAHSFFRGYHRQSA